uniref:Uncharacterized protein n=1 Tax=Physcomitrium patens TaxID=3218 RepID=A0A2K1JZ02_PHYPA|nr:hypothetical protein PHYPA_013873 [Physcomitrium patens]
MFHAPPVAHLCMGSMREHLRNIAAAACSPPHSLSISLSFSLHRPSFFISRIVLRIAPFDSSYTLLISRFAGSFLLVWLAARAS